MASAGEARNLERSVVAKPSEDRGTGLPSLVTASRWTEKDMFYLLDSVALMFRKNMCENKLLKGRKMHIECEEGSEPDADDLRVFASRKRWMAEWSGKCGSLESISEIPPMPFTDIRAPACAYPCNGLQIYAIRVSELFGGLKWPLDVFGVIAVRDSADHNRNIVYCRTRDDCETLTAEDPYLTLTGPSRAVLLDPETNMVTLEADLKVKGPNESKDEHLSFLDQAVIFSAEKRGARIFKLRSKLSSLHFSLSSIAVSVEAAIFIQVVKGSWPEGIDGDIFAIVEDSNIALLHFGAEEVPVAGHGIVELSRHVVSVGLENVLGLDVCYCDRMRRSICHTLHFKAGRNGRSLAKLDLGTCTLQVLVVWSLVSPELDGTMTWC